MTAEEALTADERAAYELIVDAEGVFQSDLWKRLDVSSRKGTRIARSLAEAELIEREEAVHDGRVTYRLLPTADGGEPSALGAVPADLPAPETVDVGGVDLHDRERTALALIERDGGVFQSDLWKALDVSSRTGSRIARTLAEAGLIEREETVHAGRTTYLLRPRTHTPDFSLLMAEGMMSPLVGIDDIDPVDSEAFTRWLFNLMADRAPEAD